MYSIAIVGKGKMGEEVIKQARARDIKIHLAVDTKLHPLGLEFTDYKTILKNAKPIAIDFTQPDQAMQNIRFYCENKLDFVIGTTGEWRSPANFKLIDIMTKDAGIKGVHGSNFSTKVHVAMITNRLLVAMLNDLPGFDVDIIEGHHPDKKDPSGTGTTMAKDIIRGGYFGKTEIISQLTGPVAPNQIMMATQRRNGIVGKHEITFTDDARNGSIKNDTITLTHETHNRSGFANGALDAAKWIDTHAGTGFYDYADIVAARFKPLIESELNRHR